MNFYIAGKFVFEKTTRPGVLTDPPIYLKTNPIITTQSMSIEEALENTYQQLLELINTFINGSGWALKAILDVDLHVATYDPLHAMSYLVLPEKLRKSKSILNILNQDENQCLYICSVV